MRTKLPPRTTLAKAMIPPSIELVKPKGLIWPAEDAAAEPEAEGAPEAPPAPPVPEGMGMEVAVIAPVGSMLVA